MTALWRRGKALKEKGELEMARADLVVVLKMGQKHLQRVSFVFSSIVCMFMFIQCIRMSEDILFDLVCSPDVRCC